eukprot:gene5898-19016_t
MLQSILKLTALLTLLLVVPIAIAAKPIPVPEPGSLSKDIINSLEFFPSSATPTTLFDQSSGEKSLKKSIADDLIQELSSNEISRDATIHVDITVPTVGMMKAEVLLATRIAFQKLTLLADYITTFFVFVIIRKDAALAAAQRKSKDLLGILRKRSDMAIRSSSQDLEYCTWRGCQAR